MHPVALEALVVTFLPTPDRNASPPPLARPRPCPGPLLRSCPRPHPNPFTLSPDVRPGPGRAGVRAFPLIAFIPLVFSLAIKPALAEGPGSAPPPASAASGPALPLPVVTVTATKREQSLASFIGAATVVDAGTLDDRQVLNTLDLARVLPGVQMDYSGSLLFPTISVRGITSAQDFYNPALTLYVDGIPQLPVFTAQALIDVDRVELLKGPQGTLYGRSAQGGVLDIVTRQPDATPALRLRAGLASRGGFQLQGEARGPLVDGLLYGSLAVGRTRQPGQLTHPVTGEDGIGGVASSHGRARLRLAPAGAPWELGLSVMRDCATASQDAYLPFDALDSRTAAVQPGMPAAFARFHQRRCGDQQALTARHDLGAWQLSGVMAWQGVDIERGFPFGPYASRQPEQWRQNVQEVRLASKGPGRAWDAVFGLYRQAVNQSRTFVNDLQPMGMNVTTSGSHNGSESLAAYGDATWHLGSRLDLSAGLRLSRDEARTRFAGTSMDMTYAMQPFSGAATTKGNHVLGRLSAGYALDPQWQVYGTLAQGYKPGGFNLAPTSPADARPFDKEESTSLELGARHVGTRLRASVALYRIDTRDAQLYSSDALGYQSLSNVGDTRSTGVEFELEWALSRRWTVGAAGFVNRARFERFDDPSCSGCADHRVPLTPANGLMASLRGELPWGAGLLRPGIAIRRVGSQYFDTANRLAQSAYTLVDTRLGWQLRDDLELTLFVNNLGDRRYRTYAFSGASLGNFAQLGSGRTAGVTLSWAY